MNKRKSKQPPPDDVIRLSYPDGVAASRQQLVDDLRWWADQHDGTTPWSDGLRKLLRQAADELEALMKFDAVLSTIHPQGQPAKCTCWLGTDSTFGNSDQRAACAVHGDQVVAPPPSGGHQETIPATRFDSFDIPPVGAPPSGGWQPPEDFDWHSLREVLCNVSQIFNGWRPDECWSQWDEEIAQAVVAIQRRIDLPPVELRPSTPEGRSREPL